MYEQVSVLTRKGQVTVPAEIRRALGLREGDKVIFSLEDANAGQISVRPVRSVAELTYGIVQPRRRPEDLKALRQQAADEVAEEVLAETPSGPRRSR
jgi:AbrB family looped-hinge helix DNA binding protein